MRDAQRSSGTIAVLVRTHPVKSIAHPTIYAVAIGGAGMPFPSGEPSRDNPGTARFNSVAYEHHHAWH